MRAFPFTKKRLLSLSSERQHKWISEWLKIVYEDLLEKHFNVHFLQQFIVDYKRICSWLNLDISTYKSISDNQDWIEYISDRFHYHQSMRGKTLREWDFLPQVIQGDQNLQKPWRPKISYQVALDNLRSAFNVGSIFRLVDAIGFESIIIGGNTPGKDHRHVKKAGMGSTDWIPQQCTPLLSEDLYLQKQKGYTIIGVETIRNSCTYLDFVWPPKGIIILGNEEYGLSKRVMSACDEFVHLPMAGRKNSINVATALAVVAFHVASLFSTK